MITALDSSVLWAIIRCEGGREKWVRTLVRAAGDGPLVISPVAFAELAPSAPDADTLTSYLDRMSITYDPITPAAAHLAGQTFKRYRLAGGPRQFLVPDFLIAAHAQLQSDRLAAVDRGYLRRWFPKLRLLAHESVS
jgi:predicted nucleic acid-binding protein